MDSFLLLSESWRTTLPPILVDPVLTLVAIVCGILVGGERQRREKPAGLRTMTLVCLGAAVFTMLSFAFTSTTGDSGRVAAQIVTGIGFLGAGVILHGRRIISGMTTAAEIWTVAAIGMAVGAGYAIAGLLLSFVVNRLMVVFFLYETRWHPDLHEVCVVITFTRKGGITRIRLERVLVDYNLPDTLVKWSELSADLDQLTLKMKMPRVHLYELLTELTDVPDVQSITQQRCELVRPSSPK